MVSTAESAARVFTSVLVSIWLLLVFLDDGVVEG